MEVHRARGWGGSGKWHQEGDSITHFSGPLSPHGIGWNEPLKHLRYIWMVEKNSLSSGEFSIRISSTLSFLFCFHFSSLSESVPIKKTNRGIGNRCGTSLKAARILQMNWGDLVSPNPGFFHLLVCVKRARREVFQEGGRSFRLILAGKRIQCSQKTEICCWWLKCV